MTLLSRTFTCLLQITLTSKPVSFFDDVYEVAKLIPEGRVTSYGAIAKYLGTKGSARMVGWALSQAVALPDVPAHRVVNRLGMLTGRLHFDTPEAMQQQLEAEGVPIANHKVQKLKDYFWDPEAELA